MATEFLQLPDDMSLTWNCRLTKTAGFCRYKYDPADRTKKVAAIELSVKVCDSAGNEIIEIQYIYIHW